MNKFNIFFLIFLTFLFLAMLIADIQIKRHAEALVLMYRVDREIVRKEVNKLRERRLLIDYALDKISVFERHLFYRKLRTDKIYVDMLRNIDNRYLKELKLLGFDGETLKGE